jgi:hypothetical protein
LVAVLVAAAGLIYTGRQWELARKATSAQLLLNVDAALRDYDATIFGLRDGTVPGDDYEVLRLMGAMERLHVLITKGLVDASEIEDLHGWRLQALLQNDKVRAYLDQYPNDWQRLSELDRLLSEQRIQATRRGGR